MVKKRECDATSERPPPGARSAEHHHDQKGQRQVRRGRVRRGPTDEEYINDATRGCECAREHERQQAEAVRVKAEHIYAAETIPSARSALAVRRTSSRSPA